MKVGEKVVETVRRAASNYRDGTPVDMEILTKIVSPELGFIVANELGGVGLGGGDELVSIELRATVIFRKEDGVMSHFERKASFVILT